ncbi:hypothetical protein Ciccas_003553 [Cichlidogyrus casuarinus]|uniref:PDZ domain-containing protein n=1 Tax=Cichlidogyrus casuarinus TaxID=1844966 RepID=A0ABD2QE29_9PLAT
MTHTTKISRTTVHACTAKDHALSGPLDIMKRARKSTKVCVFPIGHSFVVTFLNGRAKNNCLKREIPANYTHSTKTWVIVSEYHREDPGQGLGIGLECVQEVEPHNLDSVQSHYYLQSIDFRGPVGKANVLEPGDEMLQINDRRLHHVPSAVVAQRLESIPLHGFIVAARKKSQPAYQTSSAPQVYDQRSRSLNVSRNVTTPDKPFKSNDDSEIEDEDFSYYRNPPARSYYVHSPESSFRRQSRSPRRSRVQRVYEPDGSSVTIPVSSREQRPMVNSYMNQNYSSNSWDSTNSSGDRVITVNRSRSSSPANLLKSSQDSRKTPGSKISSDKDNESRSNKITVVSGVQPGSIAARDGRLGIGDRIVYIDVDKDGVDDQSTKGFTSNQQLIDSVPVGEPITLTVCKKRSTVLYTDILDYYGETRREPMRNTAYGKRNVEQLERPFTMNVEKMSGETLGITLDYENANLFGCRIASIIDQSAVSRAIRRSGLAGQEQPTPNVGDYLYEAGGHSLVNLDIYTARTTLYQLTKFQGTVP